MGHPADVLFINNGPLIERSGHNTVFMELVANLARYDSSHGGKIRIHIASLNWTRNGHADDQKLKRLLKDYDLCDVALLRSHRLLASSSMIAHVANIVNHIIAVLRYVLKNRITTTDSL